RTTRPRTRRVRFTPPPALAKVKERPATGRSERTPRPAIAAFDYACPPALAKVKAPQPRAASRFGRDPHHAKRRDAFRRRARRALHASMRATRAGQGGILQPRAASRFR